MFLGQGLSITCQAAYFILLARLLGSIEFGIYVGVAAMVSILSQYSLLGSQTVFLRYVSPEPKNFAHYWGNVLAMAFTLGSLFVVFLTLVGPHVAHSYSWTMVLCVAIGDCLFAQLTAASGRVFQTFEKLRITASLNVLTNLLRTLLAGLMLWRLGRATAGQWAVATLMVSFTSACAALVLVTRQYGRPSFSPRLLRERTGEGLVFAFSYSTSTIYNDIDKPMLGHYGMNAANGIYSMACRVIEIATMPLNSFHVAAFPRFFRQGIEGVRSTRIFALQIVKRTAPVSLFVAVVMLLAAPIIPHLLGKSFAESVPALRWLCLLPFFRSFNFSAGDALTGAGHLKLRLSGLASAAAFNFGVNLYLIPHYGWVGAAWSSLATEGLIAVFNWIMLLGLTSRGNKTQSNPGKLSLSSTTAAEQPRT
jgi:O-antigen/teichoic acid export membrane protein